MQSVHKSVVLLAFNAKLRISMY